VPDQGRSDAKYPGDVGNIYFPACNPIHFRLSTDSRSHIARFRLRSPIVHSSPTLQLSVRNRTRRRTRFSIPMSHVNKSSGAYPSFLCSLIVQQPTFASIVAHYVIDIDLDRIRALIPVGIHLPYLFLCLASFHFANLPRVFPIFLASVSFVSQFYLVRIQSHYLSHSCL
jgi:hypothetical protein